MTWITDKDGTRWVAITSQRKSRRPGRALKFGNVAVGDQLMVTSHDAWRNGRPHTVYYIVTDLWFDPVKGQEDAVAGQMVGYSQIANNGVLTHKSATTVRGLASQQFQVADIDYLGMCLARAEAYKDGLVVGIFKNKKRR
jgi:hypothetical protein